MRASKNFPREGGSFPLAGQRQAQRAATRGSALRLIRGRRQGRGSVREGVAAAATKYSTRSTHQSNNTTHGEGCTLQAGLQVRDRCAGITTAAIPTGPQSRPVDARQERAPVRSGKILEKSTRGQKSWLKKAPRLRAARRDCRACDGRRATRRHPRSGSTSSGPAGRRRRGWPEGQQHSTA